MRYMKRFIAVSGLNLERFLNTAAERGIIIEKGTRHGRKIRGICKEEHLQDVQLIAENGGWKLEIGERAGVGRVVTLLCRRWLLASLLAAMTGALILASQFVWLVQVIGAGVYQADVEAYLENVGVRPFAMKRRIQLNELCDKLEWRYPDVANIECGFRGATLCIRFYLGKAEGETLSIAGGEDVIAARCGIIERVITFSGTPAVKKGDFVCEGDALIRGEERAGDECMAKVKADGAVYARVWDGASVRISAYEEVTTYTGNTEEVVYGTCLWFPLQTAVQTEFERADAARSRMPLGGLFFPCEIIWEKRLEAKTERVMREPAELEREAREAALLALAEKTRFEHDIVDKWVDCCMIEDEVIEAVAICERVIDIADAGSRPD